MPPGTPSFRPLGSTPSPGQLRAHIGDMPVHILERILVDNVLEDGGLPSVSNFVVAAPILAAKAIRTVPHLFIICGVDELGFRKDWWFWRKFSKLRRYQSRNGLWRADDNSALREEARAQEERVREIVTAVQHQDPGGIANWRKDIPAADGTDETLWDSDIDFEQELERLRSQ